MTASSAMNRYLLDNKRQRWRRAKGDQLIALRFAPIVAALCKAPLKARAK